MATFARYKPLKGSLGGNMTHKKFPYIDALRGVAILAVVLVHVGQRFDINRSLPFTKWGQFGVQLFFVLSAFTLCNSMRKLTELTPREYASFMVRRFFRIAPMYYLAIPLYLIIAALSASIGQVFNTTSSGYTGTNVLLNFAFLHGFSTSAANGVVPGGWSIGAEFLFYAFFPFLCFNARSTRWGLFVATAVAIGVDLVLVMLKVWLGAFADPQSAHLYYLLPNQFICFAIGTFFFIHQNNSQLRRAAVIAAIPSAVLLALLHDRGGGSWLVTPALASIISVALLVICSHRPMPGWLTKVGELSYSIYIMHFLVVWTIGWISLSILRIKPSIPVTGGAYVACALLSFGVSWITNRYIERPGIEAGRRIATKMADKPRTVPV
jgi:peptidoglycan/LPS O-acetylase OafA/YrhL